jgi:hypothetical protein
MIELIKDKKQWDETLCQVKQYDFYHTFDYHQISKKDDEVAVLIKYTQNEHIVAFPLLIRKIENSSYVDATSVYGYPGPLTTQIQKNFDIAGFQDALGELLYRMDIVSVFSRLNPFFGNQLTLLGGLGELISPGSIVNIDLTQDPELQLLQYHKRLRTYINKSRRFYTVRKMTSSMALEQFIDIYYENMRRVNAASAYFFDKNYFQDLFDSKDFRTILLGASDKKTGEVIAGAIFTRKNKVVHYHLSGSKTEYLKLNPIKLIIEEMRLKAIDEGCRHFNLGGGVGNKEDSLFRFKSGFSNEEKPFYVWRYIVNNDIYNKLVEEKRPNQNDKTVPDSPAYFPNYRVDERNTKL